MCKKNKTTNRLHDRGPSVKLKSRIKSSSETPYSLPMDYLYICRTKIIRKKQI